MKDKKGRRKDALKYGPRPFQKLTNKQKEKRQKGLSKRLCNRCDQEFMPDSKFNVICPDCTEINANISPDMEGINLERDPSDFW